MQIVLSSHVFSRACGAPGDRHAAFLHFLDHPNDEFPARLSSVKLRGAWQGRYQEEGPQRARRAPRGQGGPPEGKEGPQRARRVPRGQGGSPEGKGGPQRARRAPWIRSPPRLGHIYILYIHFSTYQGNSHLTKHLPWSESPFRAPHNSQSESFWVISLLENFVLAFSLILSYIVSISFQHDSLVSKPLERQAIDIVAPARQSQFWMGIVVISQEGLFLIIIILTTETRLTFQRWFRDSWDNSWYIFRSAQESTASNIRLNLHSWKKYS